jgi:hypothetical protein
MQVVDIDQRNLALDPNTLDVAFGSSAAVAARSPDVCLSSDSSAVADIPPTPLGGHGVYADGRLSLNQKGYVSISFMKMNVNAMGYFAL